MGYLHAAGIAVGCDAVHCYIETALATISSSATSVRRTSDVTFESDGISSQTGVATAADLAAGISYIQSMSAAYAAVVPPTETSITLSPGYKIDDDSDDMALWIVVAVSVAAFLFLVGLAVLCLCVRKRTESTQPSQAGPKPFVAVGMPQVGPVTVHVSPIDKSEPAQAQQQSPRLEEISTEGSGQPPPPYATMQVGERQI